MHPIVCAPSAFLGWIISSFCAVYLLIIPSVHPRSGLHTSSLSAFTYLMAPSLNSRIPRSLSSCPPLWPVNCISAPSFVVSFLAGAIFIFLQQDDTSNLKPLSLFFCCHSLAANLPSIGHPCLCHCSIGVISAFAMWSSSPYWLQTSFINGVVSGYSIWLSA